MSLRVQNPLLAARFKAEKNTRVSAAFGGVRSFNTDAFTQLAGDVSPDMVSGAMKRLAEIESREQRMDRETRELFDSLPSFEPTESELQEMYSARDLEDIDTLASYR